LVMLILSLMVLSGCNTMHGLGQDMEKAGEAIQKKSSD
jgi:entericidin B